MIQMASLIPPFLEIDMKEFCIVRSYAKKGKKEVVDHKVTIN